MSSDYEKSPRYFSSTSKINLAIMMDKTNFENIKKGILNGRKPEKNIDIEGNPFKNNSFKPNKLEIEFDTDDRGKMLMGYDPNTGKRLKKSEETILGYNFSILSLNLN